MKNVPIFVKKTFKKRQWSLKRKKHSQMVGKNGSRCEKRKQDGQLWEGERQMRCGVACQVSNKLWTLCGMRDPLFNYNIRNKAWGPRGKDNNIIVEGNKKRGNIIGQLEKEWGNENTQFPSGSIQITFRGWRHPSVMFLNVF